MKSPSVFSLIAMATFSAFVVVGSVACTSLPKPATSPGEAAQGTLKAKGAQYLETCESDCRLPGLISEEQASAYGSGQVERLASLSASASADEVSSYQQANDYANRFNREMFRLTQPSRGLTDQKSATNK